MIVAARRCWRRCQWQRRARAWGGGGAPPPPTPARPRGGGAPPPPHDHHSTCRTVGGVHHTSLVSSRCASAVETLIRSDLGGCAGSARSAAPHARLGGTGGLGADRRQEPQGDHRQGDVPVPGVIAADLVVIQAELALGLLVALLNLPTTMHS